MNRTYPVNNNELLKKELLKFDSSLIAFNVRLPVNKNHSYLEKYCLVTKKNKAGVDILFAINTYIPLPGSMSENDPSEFDIWYGPIPIQIDEWLGLDQEMPFDIYDWHKTCECEHDTSLFHAIQNIAMFVSEEIVKLNCDNFSPTQTMC